MQLLLIRLFNNDFEFKNITGPNKKVIYCLKKFKKPEFNHFNYLIAISLVDVMTKILVCLYSVRWISSYGIFQKLRNFGVIQQCKVRNSIELEKINIFTQLHTI